MIEILWISLALLLIIIGIIGSVVPAIPGPPVGYIGMLILYFIDKDISITEVIVWGAVVLLITILDNIIPPLLTKRAGGSKSATMGSLIGVFFTIFFSPVLIFLGAFLGAFIGELIHNSNDIKKAILIGFYSFLGFITGTFTKIILMVAMLIVSIFALF